MGSRQARTSPWNFARYLAPHAYDLSWHHELLYSHLDRVISGDINRLLVQMPPGHGKSEAVSRLLPAYSFGVNPDARIIACSHTQGLAADMNRDVQRIMDDWRYALVFPETKLNAANVRTVSGSARRNADVFDIVGNSGYYKCAGVGVGIVGRRFDLGIIDDPIKDRKTANSPTLREDIWRWYTGVFHSRTAKDARIILTLTRWHEDDLAGRLLQREPGEWTVLSLPAVATGIDPHPDDHRKPGEALWPWFKNVAALDKIRAMEPQDFAALYQQNPRPEGGLEWPSDFFGPDIWFDDWPVKDIIVRVMALDPSKGRDAKTGDYSAFVMLGLDRQGRLWCDADLARRHPSQIVEDGLRLHRYFSSQAIAVETNQFQELLAHEFLRIAKEKGTALPLFGISNHVPKKVRIRTVGQYLARREIRFRANSPGAKLLVQQLRDFPCGDHDDGPDALDMAIRMMRHLLGDKSAVAPPELVRSPLEHATR